jgi:NAD(P)-dependent dehydrogenase (short-subunit alcohol dehydrogenase family)
MNQKQVVLITGANQGIGLQIAKELLARGMSVLVGARSLEKGLAATKELGEGATAIQIDVADQNSISAAAEKIEKEVGRLDVLVNNAAISKTRQLGATMQEHAKKVSASKVDINEVKAIWETNVFGPLLVTQAMLPLLRKSPLARIVMVSSEVGSLTAASDPKNPYRTIYNPGYAASKTALNGIMMAFAIELESEGIKVNAVSPGFTKTNLNGYAGTETVEQGARAAVQAALLGADGPTGTFFNATRGRIDW